MRLSLQHSRLLEPQFAAMLLGLGLRNLSMAPRNIPRVRIRNLDMFAATRRARAIMYQSDSGRDRRTARRVQRRRLARLRRGISPAAAEFLRNPLIEPRSEPGTAIASN
jgi:hypothetical protein